MVEVFRTSYYVDADTPNPAALFEAARERCFQWLKGKLVVDSDMRVKLEVLTQVFEDTDKTFHIKTLRMTVRNLV